MAFPARLPIPDAVLGIARQLETAGYETWCVGGAIRDNLLGVENHDFDLTTAAPPAEVRRLFKRTVPVGIEHGTVAVLDRHNRTHEVTTFRRDIKTDGRHAVVEFGVSLMDDLARRDFTINAIAYHPGRHEWRDPFKGVEDLERRVIRSVGDANWRFQEDYLRILRALRFSARFEFRIHPRTLEAAKANVQGLAQLSAERVRDEWFKGIATAQRVSKLLALWIDTGAARIWLPEIRRPGNGKGEKGNVDKLPRDPVLITALLASDPASLLTRLKCSNKDIERGRAIGQWRDKYPDPQHLPEAFTRSGAAAPGLVLAGYLAVHLTQHTLTPHFHFGEETHAVNQLAGTSALVGLLLHTFFDGVAIASAFLVRPALGMMVFIAIFLHKLPEGVTIASLYLAVGRSGGQAVGAAASLGLATLAGVALTDQITILERH